jgi:hypothetical protein
VIRRVKDGLNYGGNERKGVRRMAGQGEERNTPAATGGGQESASGATGAAGETLEEHEPEAEQESAAAMDAEVPQPPDASQTTEGQPS